MDWIMRNMVLVLVQSVGLNLPSSAINFNCPIFSDTSKPSCVSLTFKSDQYFLALSVGVNAPIMSTTENHHSSLNQVLLIFLPGNTTKDLSESVIFQNLFGTT